MSINLEYALERKNQLLRQAEFDLAKLPSLMRNLHLVESLNFELANGGVDQWLSNNTGSFAAETLEALEVVGATRTAALVRRIIQSFPDESVPKEGAERIAAVLQLRPRLGDVWNELGNQILEWPDDIDALLRQYLERETKATGLEGAK